MPKVENEIEALHEELGFCLCGNPERNLRYVLKGLMCLDSGVLLGKLSPEVFGSSGAAWFFAYWANSAGLEEHGAGIPGWLSPKGKGMVERIKQALPDVN